MGFKRSFNKRFNIIVSIIGLIGFLVFKSNYIAYGMICFLAIIFNEGLKYPKELLNGGKSAPKSD